MEYKELIQTMLIHPHICRIAKLVQHEKRTRLLGLLLETDGIFRIEFNYTLLTQGQVIFEPNFIMHNDGVFVFVEYHSPDSDEPNKIIIQKHESTFSYLAYHPDFIHTVFMALENFHIWDFSQEEEWRVIRKIFSISDYSENQFKKRAITNFLEMNHIKMDYTFYER